MDKIKNLTEVLLDTANAIGTSEKTARRANKEFSSLVVHLRPIGDYDCELIVEQVAFASRSTLFTTHIPKPDRVTLENYI